MKYRFRLTYLDGSANEVEVAASSVAAAWSQLASILIKSPSDALKSVERL